MFTFFLVWYFFTITTYGAVVPAGLFLPGIIIGCAVGSFYETIRMQIAETEDNSPTPNVTPILCAAGAMLSGYVRLTYSLVVIMLETTSSINLFIPMMLGILVSRAVANVFTASLYDRALRMKQMPVLRATPPKRTRDFKCSVFMARNLVTLQSVADMPSIIRALKTSHNAFPVLNTAGKPVGLITKHVIAVLLD